MISENDWISVTLHRLNSKTSKAVFLKTSFAAETPGAAIQNSFKKYSRRFTYSTTATIKLFTATVILQFYLEESTESNI